MHLIDLDNPYKFINLILSSSDGENYDMYRVDYNISEEEKQELIQVEYIDLSNKVSFTKIDENHFSNSYQTNSNTTDEICYEIVLVEGTCASGMHGHGDENCSFLGTNKEAPPSYFIITEVYCGYGGGGGSGGGGYFPPSNPWESFPPDDSFPDYPPLGGGSSGGNIKNPPKNTTPVNSFTRFDSFYISLMLEKPELWTWLKDTKNSEIKEQIVSYINNLVPISSVISVEEQLKQRYEFVENLIQLLIEIQDNECFLVEIPSNQLQNWQQLVQHKVPQSVVNKIKFLDKNGVFGDFKIQYIEKAKGKIINLDYFSVNITSLPNNPSTGIQFSPEEFLKYIRLNINNFIDTSYSEFSPSTITAQSGFISEESIWNSNYPLGAIIHIDIPQPAGDGSVVCSLHDENYWIFTTIEVPWRPFLQEYDGIHPVSGHRQFGIIQNSNGSYTVYTRGADRMTDGIESFFAENFIAYPFEAPDNLWNSFREGVYNFVNNNGGNASSLNLTPPEIWRPNWDKVKDILQGIKPISDLETD